MIFFSDELLDDIIYFYYHQKWLKNLHYKKKKKTRNIPINITEDILTNSSISLKNSQQRRRREGTDSLKWFSLQRLQMVLIIATWHTKPLLVKITVACYCKSNLRKLVSSLGLVSPQQWLKAAQTQSNLLQTQWQCLGYSLNPDCSRKASYSLQSSTVK